MFDFIDKDIWIGLLALTALLYAIKFLQRRMRSKVYRISPDSLERSRTVLRAVLPLLDDDNAGRLRDESELPYDKEHVMSAAKILAYYYARENKMAELKRVRDCFVGLSLFQRKNMTEHAREHRANSERERLLREFECYIARTPICKGMKS